MSRIVSNEQPGRPQPVCAAEALEERRLMSTVVALAGNTLLFFDSTTPDQTLGKVKIRGLARKETLDAIDFRPSTGQLYGVGSTSRLYVIDPTTGTATAVGTAGAAFTPPLAGTAFGADFNPVTDDLRVVSEADENFRLSPTTGAVVDFDPATASTQTDLALAYIAGDPAAAANPAVTDVAYTRETAGTGGAAGTATAYGIDSDTNALVRIGSVGGTTDSPNRGRLTTVGALGLDVTATTGFDIDTNGATDVGLASLATTAKGSSGLYTVDLGTGTATLVGNIRGSKRAVTDIAVLPRGNTILALTAKNRAAIFDSNLPTVVLNRFKISGLARRETALDVDVRPSTGAVYLFTNQNRLYTLNTTSGAATSVTTTPTSDITITRRAQVGFDFNPITDAGQVVDTAGQNFRLDPVSGAIVDADPVTAGTQLDTPLVYASTDAGANSKPDVSNLAFADALNSATTTTAYAIDATTNNLVTLGSLNGTTAPATGQLFTVGALGAGVDPIDPVAFDIVTNNLTNQNVGYATFRGRRVKPMLYRIDLTTGAATSAGLLGKGVSPIGITVLRPLSNPTG